MKRAGRPRGSITARVPVRPVMGEDGKPLRRVYDVTLRVPSGEDAYGNATYTTHRRRGKHSRKEADAVLAELIGQVSDGTLTPRRHDADTASAYVAAVIEKKLARGEVREKTARNYRYLHRAHIAPALGSKTLAELDSRFLQAFVDGLSKRYAARTVRHTWAVVDGALAEAVRMHELRRNPGDDVVMPKVQKTAMLHTPAASVREVLELSDEPYTTLFSLMAILGMRRSEALGLELRHVNLDTGVLLIRQGLHRVSGLGLITAPPKSTAGIRDIPLGPESLALVKRAKAHATATMLRLGVAVTDSTPLFPTSTGSFHDPDNVRNRFSRLTKEAGVKLQLRELRNYAITSMIDAGVDPSVVARIVGHATSLITLDVYTRVRPDAMRAATSKVESLIVISTGTGTGSA